MRRLGLWIPVVAWSAALAIALLVAGRLLLTPVQGDVIVLASAHQTDQIVGSSIEIHSSSGWTLVGKFSGRPVPAAPATVTLLEARVPIGSYDRVRLRSLEIPVRVSVQQNVLTPVLIGVAAGGPTAPGCRGDTVSASPPEILIQPNACSASFSSR